jgi:hypothetical protein
MSSPAGVQMAGPQSQNQQPQAAPAVNDSNVSEDGVSFRPMRRRYITMEGIVADNAYSRNFYSQGTLHFRR